MQFLAILPLVAILMITITSSARSDNALPSYLQISSALKYGSVFAMILEGDPNEISHGQLGDAITFWGWKIPTVDIENQRLATVTIHQTNDQTIPRFHPHIIKLDSDLCLLSIEDLPSDVAVRDNVIKLALNENYENMAMSGIIGTRPECTVSGLGITMQADQLV